MTDEKKAKQEAARAAWAAKQSAADKAKNEAIKATLPTPRKPDRKLSSGEAWTEWYSKHPDSD